MSEYAARQALERMNLREVAVAASYSMLGSDLRSLASANVEEQKLKATERRSELCEAYGYSGREQRKPFAFANGMAIIPVSGSLINRFQYSFGYVTGYNFIRSQLKLAVNDEDVKGIVLDVNSYGGEAAGCFELSDDIYAARDKKPIMAVIDSNSYSAGYAIASAATKVVMTPSGGCGSIGVVAMHVDMSKLLSDIGYKITFIHFGDHKVDGNPYEPLSAEVKGEIQKSVDKSGEAFVALVARNRKMDAAKVKDTQARTYRAEEALSLGLIDTIATPSQAVQVFFDELSGSDDSQLAQGTEMTDAEKAAAAAAEAQTAEANKQAVATAAAEARTAEKARVSGILNCEEAKGKGKLANHLALNTDMSLDVAKGLLTAAAPEQAATDKPAEGANNFEQAMDKNKHPNIDGQGGSDDKGESAASRILRAQAVATGQKVAA